MTQETLSTAISVISLAICVGCVTYIGIKRRWKPTAEKPRLANMQKSHTEGIPDLPINVLSDGRSSLNPTWLICSLISRYRYCGLSDAELAQAISDGLTLMLHTNRLKIIANMSDYLLSFQEDN